MGIAGGALPLAATVLAGMLCSLSISASAQQFCTRTEAMDPEGEKQIRVSGVMHRAEFLDPESKPETAWILKLDDPLTVIEPKDEWHEGGTFTATEIQVWPTSDPSRVSVRRLSETHVVIKGDLGGAENAHHFSRVRILVRDIYVGGRIACDGSEVK